MATEVKTVLSELSRTTIIQYKWSLSVCTEETEREALTGSHCMYISHPVSNSTTTTGVSSGSVPCLN